jgi:hypothetical protein
MKSVSPTGNKAFPPGTIYAIAGSSPCGLRRIRFEPSMRISTADIRPNDAAGWFLQEVQRQEMWHTQETFMHSWPPLHSSPNA